MDSNSVLRYEVLVEFLMVEIRAALCRIQSESRLPQGITLKLRSFNARDCNDCIALRQVKEKDGIYTPWTHCIKCAPAVTQTRLGPCVLVEWQDPKKQLSEVTTLAMDLITSIPIQENDVLGLYRRTLTSVMTKKPSGWRRVIEGYVKRDRVLGDDMEEIERQTREEIERRTGEEAQQPKNFVSLKFLSFGSHPNYSVRPGQSVEITKFDKPNVREAYVIVKCLSKRLDLVLPPYLSKKCILGNSAYQNKEMESLLIVLNALEYSPELNLACKNKIDIEAFHESVGNEGDKDTIPLCAQQEPSQQ